MLDMILKSVMPPGMTVEQLTTTATGLADRMIALAESVEHIKAEQAQQGAMLRQITAFCQAQAASLTPITIPEEKPHGAPAEPSVAPLQNEHDQPGSTGSVPDGAGDDPYAYLGTRIYP